MKKAFDAVKFQRERRTALSKKLEGMTPKEAIEFLRKSVPPITKKHSKTRHRA